VTNSVEVEVGESHHGEVVPGLDIRDLSASLDKFISERERGLMVLCQNWFEENIPSFEGVW